MKKRSDRDDESLVGATINGRFRIVSLIARGGMGTVYKGEQTALGRPCAVKVLSPKHDGGKDPEFAKRFTREAETSARLTHPNTVTVFDYGRCELNDVYYIAMEYLDGRTVHGVLKEEGAIAEARANRIAQQICRSLAEAHKLGVVHRDLKPSNVALLERGDEPDFVKVLDFGLVKDVTGAMEELTQTGLFMGSPKYMAPEQVLGTPVSPRTDVYAVGVILYEMLTGKVPFDRKASMSTLIAHVNDKPPPMRSHSPDIALSDDMEAVVMRCLEKQPESRFASMRDLLAALKRAAGDLSETAESLPRVRLDAAASSRPASLPPGESSGPSTRPAMSVTPPSISGTMRSPIVASTPPPRPSESIAPPSPPSQGSRSSIGTRGAAPLSVWKPYVVAVLASVLGGGAAALVLSRRPPDGDAKAASTASAAVAIALPPSAEPPKMGPGVRIVTVESDPPGATVSDHGVEVCMATPCRVYWTGASADADHKLKLTKRGYRSVNILVQSGQDTAKGLLEADAPAGVAPAAVAAPDPYAGVRADPTPSAPSATATATAVAAPPPVASPSLPPVATATATATVAAAPAPVATATAAAAPAVLHMEEGMTRPTRVSGAQPVYPREAMEAKVSGTVVAKCVIAESGAVSGCRIVKGLPFMDQPVLAALSSWRYTPATRDGKPVSVDYAITIKIVPP